jgi:uncharacterized protein YhjY with autotransporter beta-barrel domain
MSGTNSPGESGGGGGGGGGTNGNGAGATTVSNIGATIAGQAGGAGGAGPLGAGGGGGGAGGYGVIITGGGANFNSGMLLGGNGGAGGNSRDGGGGFGGDGGFGAILLGTGASFDNAGGTIRGGNGGDGGDNLGGSGSVGVIGGNGGNGGVGLSMSDGTVMNSGSIVGGNGGTGGSSAHGTPGTPGAGGAGTVGSGLTIDNSGSIIGGLADGGAGAQAYGIVFTGGTNSVGGTGTISGGIDVQGGSFAPALATSPIGTPLVISGPLTFASGTQYVVRISPAAADSAVVQGAASLTGAIVNAQFSPGSYVSKQYTILTTTAGLGGTSFTGLSNANLPSGASDSLSYSADDVFLNLIAGFTTYTGLDINQQNVANALTKYFNSTGGIPATFFGLSPSGLTQIDGEDATGAEDGAFQMMDEFLGLMLDPFVDGRGTGGTLAGPGSSADNGGNVAVGANDSPNALAYSGDAQSSQSAAPAQLALASLPNMKEPPPLVYQPRFSAWASGYGGLANIDGNATAGSNNVSADVYGSAAGLDYHVDPNTVVGLALAGAGMGWDLASGLGSGHGDAFQAGVYGTTRLGPVYVAGAFGFANHWLTTNRTALGDVLSANFDAQSYGGRVEAGYRIPLVLPFILPFLPNGPMEIVPYAAVQPQDFHTPGYSETDLSGGGFGLTYNAANATDVRTELGFRADMLVTLDNGEVLDLFSRTAWAHDFLSTPSLSAVFETLPGASFIVNGATLPHNSALLTSGAELHLTPALSILAKFDSELAPGSQIYAGTGTVRYVW